MNFGKLPATSARPPVAQKGKHSEVIYKTFVLFWLVSSTISTTSPFGKRDAFSKIEVSVSSVFKVSFVVLLVTRALQFIFPLP